MDWISEGYLLATLITTGLSVASASRSAFLGVWHLWVIYLAFNFLHDAYRVFGFFGVSGVNLWKPHWNFLADLMVLMSVYSIWRTGLKIRKERWLFAGLSLLLVCRVLWHLSWGIFDISAMRYAEINNSLYALMLIVVCVESLRALGRKTQ